MIDKKQKARAYAREWWAAHPEKAQEYKNRKKEKRKRERKRQQGRSNTFDAKPTVYKPKGCVWPDCFRCPFTDCTAR